MNTRATRSEHPQGFAETGIVEYNGQEFAAGGAFVNGTHLVCLPAAHDTTERDGRQRGPVRTWSGELIGRYVITGYARGFGGVALTCYRVRLNDGREYVGRGLGAGMILRCRRAKGQTR